MSKTVSVECRSCEADFLTFDDTKEYRLRICYRCFLNGLGEAYLEENQQKEAACEICGINFENGTMHYDDTCDTCAKENGILD